MLSLEVVTTTTTTQTFAWLFFFVYSLQLLIRCAPVTWNTDLKLDRIIRFSVKIQHTILTSKKSESCFCDKWAYTKRPFSSNFKNTVRTYKPTDIPAVETKVIC